MSQTRPISGIERLGGRLCLDFVNTVRGRPAGADDDYLHTLEDFLAWAALTGMLPADRARKFGDSAGNRAGRLLAELRELRELLYRIFRPLADGARPAAADLTAFERRARAVRSRQRLEFGDGRARWRSPAPDRPGIALADPIVIDAERLLTGEHYDRIKQCEPGEGCGWMFLDTSRNRSRRWCSMKTCGSAAKARAWYRRHRQRQSF